MTWFRPSLVAEASNTVRLAQNVFLLPVNPASAARQSNQRGNGSCLDIEWESSQKKENIMLNKAIKLVAALGLITAIGTSAAFAGSCSCSRGAGGTTYCNCR